MAATSTTIDSPPEFETYDNGHQIPLIVFGSISAFLSLVGSGCIVVMASRKLKKSIMDRFLFALSISDMISSTGNLLMQWLIPFSLNLAGAIGNHASCSATGFLLMTGNIAGCIFNSYLSCYFFLVVRFSFKEKDFSKAAEIMAYLFAATASLSLNIAALVTESINPSPLFNSVCTYATYPWTCNENEDLDCERSSREKVTPIVYVGGSILLIFTILGFVCTTMVAYSVRKTLKRSIAHRFEGDRDEAGEERLRQVSIQAIVYSLVYLNTFFWPFVGAVLSSQYVHTAEEIQEIKMEPRYYAFQFLYWMLYPLQVNFFDNLRHSTCLSALGSQKAAHFTSFYSGLSEFLCLHEKPS